MQALLSNVFAGMKIQNRHSNSTRMSNGPIPNKYIPAGPRKNVSGTRFKNPKIAKHVEFQHNKWLERKG